MLIKGKDLTAVQLFEVLRTFVNRNHAIGEGKRYESEMDWVFDHAFYFIKDGSRLNRKRKYCLPKYFADIK